MPQPTKLSKEYRGSLMKARMEVIVCADGIRRNALRPLTRDEQVRLFWEKVDIRKLDKCWPWMGCTCGSGRKYGSAYFEKKLTKAHRISYEITFGPIPKGLLACHKCDNPICVNPHHIFIGTQKENLADMIRKGRRPFVPGPKGEASPVCKITTASVLMARRLKANGQQYAQISKATGIGESNLWQIFSGRTWTHV